jgi:hypothetical protein
VQLHNILLYYTVHDHAGFEVVDPGGSLSMLLSPVRDGILASGNNDGGRQFRPDGGNALSSAVRTVGSSVADRLRTAPDF